jgi:hypothetical protein
MSEELVYIQNSHIETMTAARLPSHNHVPQKTPPECPVSEDSMHKYKTTMLHYAMAMRKFGLLLLLSSIISIIHCASSEHVKFETSIQRMSNAELKNSYYGINDRIKDIENGIKMNEGADPLQKQYVISHQTYFVGGEIYGLMRKANLILDEMEKRNIAP